MLFTGCFRAPAAPQVGPAENHFGQVDVNDLLTKLISNGIIKPSQPDAAPTTSNGQWTTRVFSLESLKHHSYYIYIVWSFK